MSIQLQLFALFRAVSGSGEQPTPQGQPDFQALFEGLMPGGGAASPAKRELPADGASTEFVSDLADPTHQSLAQLLAPAVAVKDAAANPTMQALVPQSVAEASSGLPSRSTPYGTVLLPEVATSAYVSARIVPGSEPGVPGTPIDLATEVSPPTAQSASNGPAKSSPAVILEAAQAVTTPTLNQVARSVSFGLPVQAVEATAPTITQPSTLPDLPELHAERGTDQPVVSPKTIPPFQRGTATPIPDPVVQQNVPTPAVSSPDRPVAVPGQAPSATGTPSNATGQGAPPALGALPQSPVEGTDPVEQPRPIVGPDRAAEASVGRRNEARAGLEPPIVELFKAATRRADPVLVAQHVAAKDRPALTRQARSRWTGPVVATHDPGQAKPILAAEPQREARAVQTSPHASEEAVKPERLASDSHDPRPASTRTVADAQTTTTNSPPIDHATVRSLGGSGFRAAHEIASARTEQLVQTVLAQARKAAAGQPIELRFALQPEQLGSVQVRIRSIGQQLRVELLAGSTDAAGALNVGLPRLVSHLQAAGYADPDVTLNVDTTAHDSGTRQPSDGREAPRRSPSAQPEAQALHPELMSGATDGRRTQGSLDRMA